MKVFILVLFTLKGQVMMPGLEFSKQEACQVAGQNFEGSVAYRFECVEIEKQ